MHPASAHRKITARRLAHEEPYVASGFNIAHVFQRAISRRELSVGDPPRAYSQGALHWREDERIAHGSNYLLRATPRPGWGFHRWVVLRESAVYLSCARYVYVYMYVREKPAKCEDY